MAKIGTLVDNFSASPLNTTTWNASSSAIRDPQFGRVQLTASSAYPTLGSKLWDATSSSIYARIIALPASDGTPQTIFQINKDGSNYAQFIIQNGTIKAQVFTAGVASTTTIGSYSQVNHLYLRIREASGTFYFDTAPDGSTWTQQTSMAHSWDASSVAVYFIGGCSAGTPGPIYMYIDDVNTLSGIEIDPSPNTTYAYNTINVCGLTQYDTLTIQRNNPDGSIVPIRSTNAVATGNNEVYSTFDYEAPLGVSVTYTATGVTHNGDGSTTTATSTSAPVTISVPPGTVWLKSLLQPSISAQIQVQTVSDVKMPGRQQAYDVIGRKNSVVISDVRGGRSGSFTAMTTAATDQNALKTLLADGNALFLQFTAADGFSDMYFMAGDVTEHRPAETSTDTTRLYAINFTEVDSPSGQITTIPGNSWLLVTNFGSWQAVINNRSTWLAVLNTPYGSGPGGI